MTIISMLSVVLLIGAIICALLVVALFVALIAFGVIMIVKSGNSKEVYTEKMSEEPSTQVKE